MRDDVNATIAARELDVEPLTLEEAQSFMDAAEIVVNAEISGKRDRLRVEG